MSESGDYNPGPWKGYDFKDAKKAYDTHVGRSYSEAVEKKVDATKLVTPNLETKSRSPLVIACDVTGSMGESPAVIFSKLPYLDLEGKEYLGEDMEVSFAAVGDCYSDTYPLQVTEFVKGTDMKKSLEKMVIEAGGGGSCQESYDLAALYYSKNVEMPNAVHPIFIFIGDEKFYDFVDKDSAKTYAHVDVGRLPIAKVIKELQSKYSVYAIRQAYKKVGKNEMSDIDQEIHKQWADLLGEDHMAFLQKPDRVVDVIFGILAKETNRVDYFKEEIEGRQRPEQVEEAYDGLKTIHEVVKDLHPTKKGTGKSVYNTDPKAKKTKPLI